MGGTTHSSGTWLEGRPSSKAMHKKTSTMLPMNFPTKEIVEYFNYIDRDRKDRAPIKLWQS